MANEIEAVVERDDADEFEQWASQRGFIAVPNDLNTLPWRVYNVRVPDGVALDAVEYARAAPGVVSTNTIVIAPVQGD
ncbi:MAG TPA: hypothetical protein VNM91_04675 [Dehalococcoidia bacterium]|nr:hypothetical protein [Dehalococcoidia bacterium]